MNKNELISMKALVTFMMGPGLELTSLSLEEARRPVLGLVDARDG